MSSVGLGIGASVFVVDRTGLVAFVEYSVSGPEGLQADASGLNAVVAVLMGGVGVLIADADEFVDA
jgi:hypothetical protein